MQRDQVETVPRTVQHMPAICPKFALKVALLNKKRKQGEPRAFDTLTQEKHDVLAPLPDKLVLAPVLAFPRTKRTFDS